VELRTAEIEAGAAKAAPEPLADNLADNPMDNPTANLTALVGNPRWARVHRRIWDTPGSILDIGCAGWQWSRQFIGRRGSGTV